MKVFGSISRLVSILFRKDSNDITLRPNQSTTYTAARDIQLPPGDTAHTIVSATSSQTLTNKVLTAPTVNGGTADGLTSLSVKNAISAFYMYLINSPTINSSTTNTELSFDLDNANRFVDLFTDFEVTNTAGASGLGGVGVRLQGNAAGTDVVLPATGTLATLAGAETFTNKTFDADGAGNNLTNIDDGNIKAAAAIDATKIAAGTVSNTEFGYLDGVTSAIQTQLNGKASTAYVDDAVNGLKWKAPVSVATTANITLSGEQTIDGVLTSASRVLVKDQSSSQNNGIYVSDASAWTRATDFDSLTPIDEVNGAAVFVLDGSTNADKAFVETTTVATLGTDPVSFTQFSSAGTITYTANRALQSGSGGLIEVSAVTSTELGYVSGVTSAIQTQINAKLTGASFKTDWVTGDGTTKTVTHSLGTKDVMVQLYDKADDSTIDVTSVVRTSTSVVTLTASEAPSASGWRVMVVALN